jgi:hypothetical protein
MAADLRELIEILLPAGDVLHQLASARWRSLRELEQGIDLIALSPSEVRRVLASLSSGARSAAFHSNLMARS